MPPTCAPTVKKQPSVAYSGVVVRYRCLIRNRVYGSVHIDRHRILDLLWFFGWVHYNFSDGRHCAQSISHRSNPHLHVAHGTLVFAHTPRVPHGMRAHLEAASKYYGEQANTFLNRNQRMVRRDMSWAVSRQLGNSERTKSSNRLAALDKALRSMDVERSEMQIRFHEAFTQASLRFICRDDKDADIQKIMAARGWDNIKQQVLCLTPRRFGKTYAVAMFAAAIITTIPGSEQAIFSTGRRASQKMLETIQMFVVTLKKNLKINDLKLIKFNQEMLVYESAADSARGVRRAIYSYPSNAKTLRGVGGDILFLEEAAFMSMDVFYEIVTPLLEMQTTSLIAISTPQDSTNFYSELFDLKGGDGEPLFNTIKVSLICDKCMDTEHPEECTHRTHLLPPWKSKAKLAMVREIYGDQTDLLQRESLGAITQDASSVFPEETLSIAFDRKPCAPPTYAPRSIFISCDPTGGGASRMCLAAFILFGGSVYIIRLDAERARNANEIRNCLQSHIASIRAEFPKTPIIFMCESNMGQEASHIYEMLRQTPNCKCISDSTRDGILTTHQRKELYVLELQRYVVTQSLFFCTTASRVGVAMLKREMMQFKRIVVDNPRARAKFFYTGKNSGQDDTVMAVSMGLWWAMQTITKGSILR